jgi:hypothetical protein
MKSTRLFSHGRQVLAALAFLSFLPGAFAANTNTNAAARGESGTNVVHAPAQTNAVASATNSAPAELEVPVAVFDVTIQPTKDPFFPLSTRKPVPDATNAAPAFSASSFVLKALDGPANFRLAMINNRTFAVGDSNVLTTPAGKINVRVLQIKEASVVLRIDSQSDPIEIFLRKSAQ